LRFVWLCQINIQFEIAAKILSELSVKPLNSRDVGRVKIDKANKNKRSKVWNRRRNATNQITLFLFVFFQFLIVEF
jgi:hypothetical protein